MEGSSLEEGGIGILSDFGMFLRVFSSILIHFLN
jgi:hypothetical protein